MRHAQGWVNWAVASGLSLLLAACAGVPRDASLPINDPNEQVNRQVLTATRMTLRPAAQIVSAIPGPVHDRLRDFNSNLKEPRIFVNNVDRKSTRLNSSHLGISYAVFCLKQKTTMSRH